MHETQDYLKGVKTNRALLQFFLFSQETRTYHCKEMIDARNNSHHLSTSGQNLTNEILNMTGDQLILSDTSTFSSLDWKKNKDMRQA